MQKDAKSFAFCVFYIYYTFVISTTSITSSVFISSIASYKAFAVSNDVKHGTFDSTASLLILNPSLFASFPLVGVVIIKLIFPSL